MNKAIKYIEKNIAKLTADKKIPDFKAGDTIKVHSLIIEGERERVQTFEGVCLAHHKRGIATSCKLKKISKGFVFEKSFPIYSPSVKQIEVTRRGKVRRSKLYYIREAVGKAARIKEPRTEKYSITS